MASRIDWVSVQRLHAAEGSIIQWWTLYRPPGGSGSASPAAEGCGLRTDGELSSIRRVVPRLTQLMQFDVPETAHEV